MMESPYFIFIVCTVVIVDVNLSVSEDRTSAAATFKVLSMMWDDILCEEITGLFFVFQALATTFFVLEFGLRAYCYSTLYNLVTFLKGPLSLVDLLCIFTDVIYFVALSTIGKEM